MFISSVKFVCLLLILLCAQAQALSDRQLEAQFVLLPNGEQLNLKSLKGKPLYLKFWATWCQTCLQQMPHFQKAQTDFGDDIRIVAVNVGLEDSVEDIKKVAAQFGLTMGMAMDKQGELAKVLGLRGTPFHILFDENLKVLHAGHNADSELDQKLQLLSNGTGTADGSELEFLSDGLSVQDPSSDELQVAEEGLHLLYFSSTWCDWYLKETRPHVAANCERAQRWLNGLSESLPKGTKVSGVMSRLWADQSELEKYEQKYRPKHPVHVDQNNRAFHRYQVKHLPTLIIFKDGKEVLRFSDFGQLEKIKTVESKLLKF